MEYTIEEIDISEKLRELQIDFPEKLTFFPEDFETINSSKEFIYPEQLTQVRKIFKASQIDIKMLGDETVNLRSRKSADLCLPGIFVGASLLSENPMVVSIALSVLSNYVTDFFKGSFGNKTVSLEIYVEKTKKKTVKKVKYKGNAEGIKNLEQVIKNLK